MDLSYFQKINNAYQTNNKRDVDLHTIKDFITDSFEDSIDYQLLQKNGSDKQGLLVVKTKIDAKKAITAKPTETFNLGDKFQCFNYYWLVTSKDSDNKIMDTGIMKQCNYSLPFQLSDSTIVSEPCIVENLQNNIGIQQNITMTVPDKTVVVMIQYNDNTKQLFEGKRIFIDMVRKDANIYQINKIDNITKMDNGHGLLLMTCESKGGAIKGVDSTDLLIANYYTPVTPSIQSSDSSSSQCFITHNNGDLYTNADVCSLCIGGSPMPFNAAFKDNKGNIIPDIQPVWKFNNLVNISASDILLTYNDIYPLRAYIQINNNKNLKDATFDLILDDKDATIVSACVHCKVVSF
jgi:hypothetical protein